MLKRIKGEHEEAFGGIESARAYAKEARLLRPLPEDA